MSYNQFVCDEGVLSFSNPQRSRLIRYDYFQQRIDTGDNVLKDDDENYFGNQNIPMLLAIQVEGIISKSLKAFYLVMGSEIISVLAPPFSQFILFLFDQD